MDFSYDIEEIRYEYRNKSVVALVTVSGFVRKLEISYNDSLILKMKAFASEVMISPLSMTSFCMHLANELVKLRLAIGGKRILKKIMTKLTFEQIKDQMVTPITKETAEDFLDACTEQVESLTSAVKRLKQKTEDAVAVFTNSVTDFDVIDYTPFDPQSLIDATQLQLMKCIDTACNMVVIQGMEEALGTTVTWESLDIPVYKDTMKVVRKLVQQKKMI